MKFEFGGEIGCGRISVVKFEFGVVENSVVKFDVVKLVVVEFGVARPVVAVAYWRSNEARPGCLR